jgi:hypothetical protein
MPQRQHDQISDGHFQTGPQAGASRPLLWQRRDIFASDDAAATAAAQDLYRTHAAKRISNELPSLRQFWKIDLQVHRKQTQMMPSGKGEASW